MYHRTGKDRVERLRWIGGAMVVAVLITGAVNESRQRDVPTPLKPGDSGDAEQYYASVSKQLGLSGGKRPFNTLDDLLRYFGQNLKAKDLDCLPPVLLMATQKDILAARYFSPKTSDVARISNKLSWRKVVRLNAQPGSKAATAGLKSMHFLSVVYVKDRMKEPFPEDGATTINIQVLLTRDKAKLGAGKDPAYWLVFNPDAGKYSLGDSTTTSWDAAEEKTGERRYYVPAACQTCHGGSHEVAILHSFDTDWYIDKAQLGEDFGPAFEKAKWGPLYDCGTDPTAQAYKEGFAVFRKLNAEIFEQNEAVLKQAEKADPKRKLWTTKQVARQTASAAKWCELHKSSAQHMLLFQRATGEPAKQWNPDDPIDRDLLPLLNRYCYRCHTGVRYNVFIKETVLGMSETGRGKTVVEKMIEKMTEKEMPQDRDMEKHHPKDRAKMLMLLRQLKD